MYIYAVTVAPLGWLLWQWGDCVSIEETDESVVEDVESDRVGSAFFSAAARWNSGVLAVVAAGRVKDRQWRGDQHEQVIRWVIVIK